MSYYIRKRVSGPYGNVVKKWFEGSDGRRYYMKSKWEYNYALYLEFLKGLGEIKDWFYEVDTFEFEKIKYGVRRYTPDFKVVYNDGRVSYREVKGWMDKKSKTKITRFRKYYPGIELIVVGREEYNKIKQFSRIIKGWLY